ncbi:MAG: acyl-CoA dehydrogenase, partial [Sphingomicrobium sp.]
TNGIQAADLVGRKLGLDGGLAFDGLIADVRAETRDPRLMALSDAVEVAAASLRSAAPDDRLAGSYPFLTMTSVMVAGWLVERLSLDPVADDRTRAAAAYFLGAIVPEALGLAAGAEAGAALLYAVPAEALA